MGKKGKYTIAELFVGAGGSHVGFKSAEFKTVYVEDFDEDMIKAFKLNNPEIPKEIIDSRAVQKVKAKDILEKAGIEKGQLDVLFGGIVCIGFSLAGVRDPSDPSNTLYKHYLRIVKGILPKICIIENVPGMKNFKILDSKADEKLKDEVSKIYQRLEDFKGIKAKRRKEGKDLGPKEKKEYERVKKKRRSLSKKVNENSVNVVENIEDVFKDLGYNVNQKILNAGWYGAATTRERLIIVATHKKLKEHFCFPTIKYWKEAGSREKIMEKMNNKVPKEMIAKKFKKFKTVQEAFEKMDLVGVNNPEKDKENVPMNHKKKTVRRFSYIPRGKNIVEVMEKVPENLKISKYYSRGCTMRLDPNKPSPTLVPGHSNFPVHPNEDRSITVREAAVITGFPIDYKFYGNHTQRCRQVGNAVPPPLAKALAEKAKEMLARYYKRRS